MQLGHPGHVDPVIRQSMKNPKKAPHRGAALIRQMPRPVGGD